MPGHRLLGAPIVAMAEVTSTMDVARRLERLDAAEGITAIAASQTQGRGRGDRVWQSPPGTGFYCSVLLRPQISISQFQPFSIAAGLAVCDALDPDESLGLQLKWPNDILCRNQKLAGILTSSNLVGAIVDSAVVGIGINIESDITRPATAISLAEIRSTSPELVWRLAPRLFDELSARYSAICEGDADSALRGWQERLAYLGQHVSLEDGATTHLGVLTHLHNSGAVVLSSLTGQLIINSGELTRGPVPR